MNRLQVSCFYILSGPRMFLGMLKTSSHESCSNTGVPAQVTNRFLSSQPTSARPMRFCILLQAQSEAVE